MTSAAVQPTPLTRRRFGRRGRPIADDRPEAGSPALAGAWGRADLDATLQHFPAAVARPTGFESV